MNDATIQIKKQRGWPKGVLRPNINKDGSTRKKPGPKPKTLVEVKANDANIQIKKQRGWSKGVPRPDINKDRSTRKKPGPKPKIVW